MNNKDYISIGISIYNAEQYLGYAISSVLAQTHKYWELILVDDGSTDRSLEIAKDFAKLDDRIRVISDGNNRKLPYRLNQIIDEAKYSYIARMDADDLIHPERLERQLKFLIENPNYDLVSTGLVSIDNNNKVYGYRSPSSLDVDFNIVNSTYPINHATILVRKEWYQRNKYNVDFPRSQDYELWCRTSSNKDLAVAIIPDLLYYYREEGVISSKKLIKSYKAGYEAYSKYSGRNNLKKFATMRLKIATVKLLDRLGQLQLLARKRNRSELDLSIVKEHQKVIDTLLENASLGK
ncbi:glycosyltransferase family 2 protein [Psychrobacter sp. Marseille-P5312]|uniref:glycosyltransferase family 2 protein n=1 Tax=Psychrobacter sp. Marseille-P5312 TaxID=2086574 RepID=UPI000CF60B96|nr:glycosyltransferase family 2 protein [Psychrobacter sp. Marseille-P5312]